jgi:hypothetical protein
MEYVVHAVTVGDETKIKDGPMTIELLSPVTTRKGEIDLAGKRFTKQVLPLTEINYGGKKKVFDLAFCQKVEQAFKDGAFPYVPVKLAAADNAHTNDVLRTGGRVVSLSASETDGLVATLELNDDGVKAVTDSDGHLPVSVKIFEQLVRDDGDGAKFDAALAHVLLTDDPYVRGMTPWKELDAVALSENRAGSVTETIDLSAEHFGDDSEESMTKTKVELELTASQRTALLELVAEHEDLKDLDLEPGDVEDDSDEEDEVDDEEDDEKPVGGVKLSRQSTRAIELARAEAQAATAQVTELSRQLAQAAVDREVADLERTGLAPAILKLARPALEQPQVIELSRGGKVEKTDSGTIMRNVLKEIVELARTGHDVIDLERMSGVLVDDEETATARTDLQLAALRTQFDD